MCVYYLFLVLYVIAFCNDAIFWPEMRSYVLKCKLSKEKSMIFEKTSNGFHGQLLTFGDITVFN